MTIHKIKKRLEKNQRVILILGIIFLAYGLFRFLFVGPDLGVNLKTLQPTVINGAIFMALGIGLLIGWYLTKKDKDKIIQSELKELEEKKKKRKEDYNWGPRLK